LGNDFNLGGLITEARVDALSTVAGAMPLYNFDMDLEMKYYLNETVT